LQRVVLNGEASEWPEVTSGVPQGSIIGPLLFVLYVNDIAEAIQCDLEVFADDTKIYSIIETIKDIIKLQQDLNKLQDWSKLSLLSLNIDTVADKKKFPLRLHSTLNAYMENSYKTFTKR